ncbi:nad-dependent dehydrogenase [Stylonychia lemnae]|uniref:Nad-dependent dehydrogenase n=1 Tax=Stylonychia lemnae TaxID=5949 RepID=A0A078A5L7_STYLE|nr:nad-dependent dehydrogenase [Stylonychia lemnae]|eukprot:CDW77535.1 nad-dependent dehydrogenase [Stylonychia lemnae]
MITPNLKKIVITKFQDRLYAVGGTCPHQGASLSSGMIFQDKIICPWHGATFDIKSGALEQYPSVDGIPSFEIVTKNDKHYAKIPSNFSDRKIPTFVKRDVTNNERYVIIGGGPAGLSCAETLRQSGFTGEIMIVSAEDVLTYDRTQLTKNLTRLDVNDIFIRTQEYLDKADINFKLGLKVNKLDIGEKTIYLSNQEAIKYDKICIATGANPFKPPIPGINLENVLVLRTNKDQEEIKKRLASGQIKNLVIMGTGFIGSEAAASLKTKYEDEMNIEVISMESVPLERQFGKVVGQVIYDQHIKHDVKMHMNRKVVNIEGDGKNANQIVLDDGTIIDCDLILIGAGVFPSTNFLKDTEVKMDRFGGIICDPFLESSVKGVYSAGDAASFPYWPTGQRVRMEHWGTAQDQGSHAAFNMLNKSVPYGNIPFLWTFHYGHYIQYVGYAFEFDEVYVQGNLEDQDFLAYYIKDDRILAVAGESRPLEIVTYLEAMQQNIMPSASDIKSGKETVETIRKKLQAIPGSRCSRESCCNKQPSTL